LYYSDWLHAALPSIVTKLETDISATTIRVILFATTDILIDLLAPPEPLATVELTNDVTYLALPLVKRLLTPLLLSNSVKIDLASSMIKDTSATLRDLDSINASETPYVLTRRLHSLPSLLVLMEANALAPILTRSAAALFLDLLACSLRIENNLHLPLLLLNALDTDSIATITLLSLSALLKELAVPLQTSAFGRPALPLMELAVNLM